MQCQGTCLSEANYNELPSAVAGPGPKFRVRQGHICNILRKVKIVGQFRGSSGVHLAVVTSALRYAIHLQVCLLGRHSSGVLGMFDYQAVLNAQIMHFVQARRLTR